MPNPKKYTRIIGNPDNASPFELATSTGVQVHHISKGSLVQHTIPVAKVCSKALNVRVLKGVRTWLCLRHETYVSRASET